MTIDMSRKVHEQITPETWCHDMVTGTGVPITSMTNAMCIDIWLWCRYGWGVYIDAGDGGHIKRVFEHLGVNVRSGIFRWNDAPERTFDDVLQVLKELDL